MHRAADVRKKIAPVDTEKCPQKSAGFDRGTDICGFVADICGHTPTSAMIYAEVRICLQHMQDLLWTLMVRVPWAHDAIFRLIHKRAMPCKICLQAQAVSKGSDQPAHLWAKLLDTTECMNGEQRPG